MDAVQRGGGVRALAQEHDSFHHVVVVDHHAVGAMDGLADLAQANLRPLRDHGDVLDAQRRAVLRFDDGLFDVADVPDQADGAHVDLLRALLDKTAAGIGVGVGQLLLDLRQAQAVGNQLVGIDADLIFARDAAEGRIVHHVRHGLHVFADHPVLQRLQFHHVVRGIGALQRVPIDRADRAEVRADLRGHIRAAA